MTEKEAFKEFLRKKGLRVTKEREAILNEVLSRKGHFDMEELHLALRKNSPRVSRASIYRTLPLLIESGILEEVERVDKHAHYEHTTGRSHHDHMLCVSCGRVIEFYSESLEKLQNRLCRDRGFEGISHNLEIKGYCRKCARKKKAG
jgi:Fur family ferric uptake transcriptional regulator